MDLSDRPDTKDDSAITDKRTVGIADGYAPSEQLRYARVLEWGTRVGFVVLAASYLTYLTGWLPAHVGHEQLAQLWTLPVDDYLRASGVPTGWGWLALVGKGDIANLIGIGMLSGVSVLCLVAVMPFYAVQRDRTYLAVCAAEVLVLALAASGILTATH